MTQSDIEDIPLDVSAVVNTVDHLCDVAASGGIHRVAAHTPDLHQCADKLVDLVVKLESIQATYHARKAD